MRPGGGRGAAEWLRTVEPEPQLVDEPDPPRGPDRRRLVRLLVLTGAVLVAHNVVLARYDLDAAYVVAGGVVTGAALAAARLAPTAGSGSRWGVVARWLPLGRMAPAAPFLAGAVVVALVLGATDPVADDRLADAGVLEIAGRVVETLFGVAVVEEVLFRQGLLVGWSRLAPRPPRGIGPAGVGLIGSSLAFGLWHVAAEQARLDPGSGGWSWAALGGVLVTGLVAGPLLAVVRLRAGGLVAPVLVHAGFNVAVTVGVWL